MSAQTLSSTRTEFDTVLSADGTTVDDPGSVCDVLGNSLGQPVSDIDMSLLSLFDGCDFAGTDGPDGFVSDDDVPVDQHYTSDYRDDDSLPGRLGNITSNSIQLPLYNFLGLVCLSLLQGFSNTGNNTQTSFNCRLDFFSDKLVGISKHGSSFGMTKNDPVDIGIFELVGRDFTSEGSRGGGEAVLGRDLGWGLELGLDVEEVDRGRGYDDLLQVSVKFARASFRMTHQSFRQAWHC